MSVDSYENKILSRYWKKLEKLISEEAHESILMESLYFYKKFRNTYVNDFTYFEGSTSTENVISYI